ncbi:MAG: hypothetical protein IPQ07_38740 [Myxococcales bacterium]|nr:hypothetical protein [Myxococcales bacterium]
MAEKLGFFSQWLGGSWAERNTINANADALESVESRVKDLQATADRQAKEIVQLRATIMGLAEVLQAKVQFDDSELEREVNAALKELTPQPEARKPSATDPYRDLPAGDPTPEDIDAAKKLMRLAEDHHFSKRFADARSTYQEVVDKYGGTKQAVAARQQLENLRGL